MKEYQENQTSYVFLIYMLLRLSSQMVQQILLLVLIIGEKLFLSKSLKKLLLSLSRRTNLNASLFVFSHRIKVQYCMEKIWLTMMIMRTKILTTMKSKMLISVLMLT